MSETIDVMKEFEISTRINEGLTSFNITFNTPLAPSKYVTGSTFEFVLNDSTLTDEYVAITGVVESVERKNKDNNRIYGLTGRDKGRLLVKNPFTLDSNTETPTTYTVPELLDLILTGTGITIGRGQTTLQKNITLTTDGEQPNRYCGSWSTKQEAINQLFAQYIRFSGAKKFRWWIDYSGYFRWFEVNTDRGSKTYFFDDDERIIDFTVKEDATSIINDLTGFYGDEEDQQSVHIQNTASIAKYGLCVGEPITETNMTLEEITAKVQREIDQKSIPIYTATLELSDFYSIDVGAQIMFPNDPYYSTTIFTVSDWKMSKSPEGSRKTTLNLTSDESVISIANEFEVIQATAKKEVQENKAVVGVVTEIPADGSSSDRCSVWIPAGSSLGYGGGGGSGSVVSARNVGGGFILSS